MLNRSIASILIVTSSFVISIGQTPEAQKEAEKAAPKAFAFTLDGRGSYLGVQTGEVNRENFAKFGLREVRGVAVEKVIENSPAAAAGVLAGDVIVRFNGEEVTSARKLTRLISEVDPDHRASIGIVRNGTEQELNATLAKRPMPRMEDGNFTFRVPGEGAPLALEKFKSLEALKDMPQVLTMPEGEGRSFTWRAGEGRQIGIGVNTLTKQLAEHFAVERGVMISSVRTSSPAEKAGLKAGDIITSIDGKPVNADIDLIRSINEKKEGDVTLTIVRDTKQQTVTVTPEKSQNSGFLFNTDGDSMFTPLPPSMPGDMKIAPPPMPARPAIAPGLMTLGLPRPVI